MIRNRSAGGLDWDTEVLGIRLVGKELLEARIGEPA